MFMYITNWINNKKEEHTILDSVGERDGQNNREEEWH